MSAQKINIKTLRQAAARRGLFTVADIARDYGCARVSIYLALERPSRFTRVFGKIEKEVASGK